MRDIGIDCRASRCVRIFIACNAVVVAVDVVGRGGPVDAIATLDISGQFVIVAMMARRY